MNKLTMYTLAYLMAANAPAFGATTAEDHQKIQADLDAIDKDNAALRKDYDALEKDRGEKADAKANGDYGKQAGNSLEIGADKTAIQEKKAEKKVDEKILEHHKNKLAKDQDNLDNDAPAAGSNQ